MESINYTEMENIEKIEELEEIYIQNIMHIKPGKEVKYKNKIIHIGTLIHCEGSLSFESCVIHYNETDSPGKIKLGKTSALTMKDCTVECHAYDERLFIDASDVENEIDLLHCKFIDCSHFISSGASIKLDGCKFENPEPRFIYCYKKVTIKNSDFTLKYAPEPMADGGRRSSIIWCSKIEMEDCTCSGSLESIRDICASSENNAQLEALRKAPALISARWGTVKNATFNNMSNLFSMVDNSELIALCMNGQVYRLERDNDHDTRISLAQAKFNNCAYIFNNSWIAQLDNSQFDSCTRIGMKLSADTMVCNSRFNDCFDELFSSNIDGGVTFEYCEFNNWKAVTVNSAGAMLLFRRTTKETGYISTVAYCTFNGINAHKCFAVGCETIESLPGYAAEIKDCGFANCTTERSDKRLIEEQHTHRKPFGRIKVQSLIHIKDCQGVDDPGSHSEGVA